jgi:hypothetical protein
MSHWHPAIDNILNPHLASEEEKWISFLMETLQRKSSLDNLDYALIIEPITAGGP